MHVSEEVLPASTTSDRSAWRAIVACTLVAGTMDICAAIASWWLRDVAPSRVLQGVAAGLLGKDAFAGGMSAAMLGLLLHFAIMSVIATLFVLASRRWRWLVPARLLPAIGVGAMYGIVVYLVMTYIVVPLSASTGGPPDLTAFIRGVLIHIACVGIPIALLTRRFLHG